MSARTLTVALLLAWLSPLTTAFSAELFRLAPSEHPDQMTADGQAHDILRGKEVDWIFDDFVLRNDQLAVVIANPVEGRNANMTVRNVGGGIIDATLLAAPNDQLSAFYPTAGAYLFEDPALVEIGDDAERLRSVASVRQEAAATNASLMESDQIVWRCRSSSAVNGDGSAATVTYRLRDGEPYVAIHVEITNLPAPPALVPTDGVRADRTFTFSSMPLNERMIAYCHDEFFGAVYALETVGGSGAWGEGRMRPIIHQLPAQPGSLQWETRFYPATSPLDLAYTLQAVSQNERPASMQKFQLTSPAGPVAPATVTITAAGEATEQEAAQKSYSRVVVAGDDGQIAARLPNGTYELDISAPGYEKTTRTVTVGGAEQTQTIELPQPSALRAAFTDVDDAAIPCKLTIYGAEGTTDPNFGPDSGEGSIVNCVYCVDGTCLRPIDPGTYDVLVSYGPEYDVLTYRVAIEKGQTEEISGELVRTVDTSGWISAEMHSHSTPSGDNTSSQRGRVQNLLCEHLEFAPCTEHNRIDSYLPHLRALQVEQLMATCTGMELTGSLLPVNHQNAFPLHHHPHTQDGGGPRTDVNPVLQIERLAMWDNASDKVVQGNHPNIHQVYGDRDVDGVPDEGFREMLGWMDVVEVHPLESIFDPASDDVAPREFGNRIQRWMKLLNEGHLIPGVVNTDAHYNHHGSGWIRNWFQSDTDNPAEIEIAEMIHVAEHGHIVMSTGPFLEVQLLSSEQPRPIDVGETTAVKSGECTLQVRVQCPNWLDINRVQVFVNGRMDPELNYRRRTHADKFVDGVVKFDSEIPVRLESDAHLIVAVTGEGLQLGRVMGPQFGKLPPTAVSNPIYVDVDGNGFQPNGDNLGYPLPGEDRSETRGSPSGE